MKKIFFTMCFVVQIFAFDKDLFINEIQDIDKNNSAQTQKLLDFSLQWQEKKIANLPQLKSLNNKEFIEYFLLNQRLNFLYFMISMQKNSSFNQIEEAYEKYLLEKVDFLIQNNIDDLSNVKLDVCIGDICGHPTEVMNLSFALNTMKNMKNANIQIIQQIDQTFMQNYNFYRYERLFHEDKQKLMKYLNQKILKPHFETLTQYEKQNKEIADGFRNYFFNQYLKRLYLGKYYAAFLVYDDEKHGIKLDEVKRYLKRYPEICTFKPEFLRQEIIKLCK